MEQDAALGIRQLVDMACKALSPAVNDPYTAVQAIDHLSVIFCALAVRPLGPVVPLDATSGCSVVVPGRGFADYLSTMCGLIRRYGARKRANAIAGHAAGSSTTTCPVLPQDHLCRSRAVWTEAQRVLADAERGRQPGRPGGRRRRQAKLRP